MISYVAHYESSEMKNILCHAGNVEIAGQWFNVLGYDPYDDIICLEAYNGDPDSTVPNASIMIRPENVRVILSLKRKITSKKITKVLDSSN